jgi:hypothetical protein
VAEEPPPRSILAGLIQLPESDLLSIPNPRRIDSDAPCRHRHDLRVLGRRNAAKCRLDQLLNGRSLEYIILGQSEKGLEIIQRSEMQEPFSRTRPLKL